MTATTSTIPTKAATVFSTCKSYGGNYLLDSTADTALAALTTSSTVSDVLDILSALVERRRLVDRDTIGQASSLLTNSAIVTVGELVTSAAFTASQTGLAATLAPGDATITVNTNGSGDVTAVNITGGGTNYEVGDKVLISAGAGRATGTVTAVG